MKNRAPILAAVFAAVIAMPALASAQAPGHNFGLGLQLGNPGFAFGAKYFFDRTDAIQATVGWRQPYYYYGSEGPLLTVDWQHRVGTVGPRSGKLHVSFDVGVGGAVGLMGDYCGHRWGSSTTTCYNNDAEVALRVPLAVAFYFPIPRLEAYVEFAPSLVVLPYFGPDLMGGIGGRFYF